MRRSPRSPFPHCGPSLFPVFPIPFSKVLVDLVALFPSIYFLLLPGNHPIDEVQPRPNNSGERRVGTASIPNPIFTKDLPAKIGTLTTIPNKI